MPSNLTNIILEGTNHLSFAQAAGWMLLPTLCAFLAGGAAFAIRFRQQLRIPYDAHEIDSPMTAIHDAPVVWAGLGILAFLVVGYSIGGEWHLLGLRPFGETLRVAPWSILIYALGMFVIITAVFDAHLLAVLTHPLRANVTTAAGAHGALIAGSLVALLAAAVNNLPATLIGVLALRAASHVSTMAVYAIKLGVDIGPKLTPFGSLATLLWMKILARTSIHVSWQRYLRENWWVTLLVLAATFLGLLASHALLG